MHAILCHADCADEVAPPILHRTDCGSEQKKWHRSKMTELVAFTYEMAFS